MSILDRVKKLEQETKRLFLNNSYTKLHPENLENLGRLWKLRIFVNFIVLNTFIGYEPSWILNPGKLAMFSRWNH